MRVVHGGGLELEPPEAEVSGCYNGPLPEPPQNSLAWCSKWAMVFGGRAGSKKGSQRYCPSVLRRPCRPREATDASIPNSHGSWWSTLVITAISLIYLDKYRDGSVEVWVK